MNGKPALPAIMADALQSGAMGFCVADAEGLVLRRDGPLSQWSPGPGESLFAHPVLESFRDAVYALRATRTDILLPGIGLDDRTGHFKLDIRLVWMEQGDYLLVTSFQASVRAEFEALTAQSRRERQILEEQLRAREQKLLAQQRLFALFIANVPAAIAMLDQDLDYVTASDRWRREFGPALDTSILGQSCPQSLPGASPQWQKGLADCLAGQESQCDLDCITNVQGHSEWIRWRFLPWEQPAVEGDGLSRTGALLFCEVITDAVEQELKITDQARQLRTANIDMRNFSLALSHDLQAPLRQIIKFAQLLDADSGEALAGSGRDFLDEIHGAGGRMQRMVEGLLRYLRIASRPPSLHLVDLNRAAEAALANLRHDIATAEATVTVAELPHVRGDLDLLTILFQNLIQNSLKFSSDRVPAISISADMADGSWAIVYSDNGPGIAAKNAVKAFDLFQRLDDRQFIAGTGVGLAICRWIADVHGASLRIVAQSAPGLCISLSIPTAVGAQPLSSTGRALPEL